MCIVESKKSFNRWSKLMSVSDRDTVLSTSQFYYPLDVSLYVNALRESKNGLLAIELWPSSKCNHKCTFCSSKQFRSLLDNIWTKERIIRFVNEASDMGVPLIRFSGGLEPFLNRNMRYAVEQIGKKGISSLYISNGTCFDENIIHLLARYSNVVRFSINGFDENSYEVVHGVRLFHNVIHNLSNLIKLRKKYGRSNLLLIGVTYIVTKQNYQKIFEFGMMLKMMGVDFFLIRGLNPTREVFTSEEERVIKSQILKLHGLKDDDYFVSASVKKLSSGYRRKQKFARCYVPSYRLFIDCRGDIHLCFSSLINGGKPLGNIRNISLADFWRSEDMERIRCNLRNGCFYGFCSKFCDHSEFNQSIDWIRGKLEATKNEKFIKIPRKWVTSFAEAQI